MKFTYIAAIAMALVSAAAFTGCEKREPTLAEKLEQASKDVQKAADKSAKDVQKAADQTAKEAQKTVNQLAK